MGWIYRYDAEHHCVTPNIGRQYGASTTRPGDVWQCDGCQKFWIVRDSQRDGPYWEQTELRDLPAKVQAKIHDSVVPE